MLSAKEVTLVYDTLLSSPGMSDLVKIHLSLSRKNVLLLSKVIEQGLLGKEKGTEYSLLQVMDQSTFDELSTLSGELLQKGGLTSMNEKLQSLSVKGGTDGKLTDGK